MSTHILPASELRAKMSQVLADIRKDGAPCFVTKSGRAVAALLPIEVYDRLMSDLEDRLDEADAELGAEVRQARKECRAGKGIPLSEVRRRLKL